MKNILLFAFLCFSASQFMAQVKAPVLFGNDAKKLIEGSSRISYDTSLLTINHINFSKESKILNDKIPIILKTIISDENSNFILSKTNQDDLGFTHFKYQQYYKGILVEDMVYIFHSQTEILQSANGLLANFKASNTPSISGQQALTTASNDQKVDLNILENPTAELIFTRVGSNMYLAYKCVLASHQPLMNKYIYIDAQSGKKIKELSKLCAIDVIGTAHTQFSGTQNITTNQLGPTNFKLQETTNGGGIITYNANTNVIYSDTDNDWNNVNANLDEFATDVHYGAQSTYKFYFDNFGRDSYDDAGGPILSYANDASVGVNAYWSGGSMPEMHYGDGDANRYPVASLEVAGHELTHGVTEFSAGLVYADESGALNESFSDIFGNTIRFIYASDSATWYIGDQILKPGASGALAFRNMANPNDFQNADTYGGLFFNNGDIVHYDSGIQNFWYYLLVTGGSGTNDIGSNYAVSAIGMTDAMKIAYRNLNVYLTPYSTFLDARQGSEQAAIDLFGLCSFQHLEVVHAWYAVGVGPNFSTLQPNANFTLDQVFSCVAPLSVQFNAGIGYENYLWDFGDGTNSTLANPSHIYNSTGSFDVTLIVTNVTICPSTDTQTINSAVEIGLIPSVASFSTSSGLYPNNPINFTDMSTNNPTSWLWDFGDGTTSNLQNPIHSYTTPGTYTVNLTVNNCGGTTSFSENFTLLTANNFCGFQSSFTNGSGILYDSGGELNDYMDNESCGILLQPCEAEFVQINVQELNLEDFYDYLYIYDGPNTSSPLLATLSGYDNNLTYTSTGPSVYILFESDISVTASGFLIIYEGMSSVNNSASFTASNYNPFANNSVQFTDNSVSNPTSWFWDFDGISTSTLQNPNFTFTTPGLKTVTLTVGYCGSTTEINIQNIQVQSTAGISDLNETESIFLAYPNPFQDHLILQPNINLENLEMTIKDMSGRVVFEQKTEGMQKEIEITTDFLSPGNYILECRYKSTDASNGVSRFNLIKIR